MKTLNQKIKNLNLEERIIISAEIAEKILKKEDEIINDLTEVFECGLQNDYNTNGISDFHSETKEEMEKLLLEKTQWSILFQDGKVYIDWKNEISGFGTGFWGHDPIRIKNLKAIEKFIL